MVGATYRGQDGEAAAEGSTAAPGPAFCVIPIPMGTANDFAKSLALGPEAVDAVIELVNGSLRPSGRDAEIGRLATLWMINAARRPPK